MKKQINKRPVGIFKAFQYGAYVLVSIWGLAACTDDTRDCNPATTYQYEAMTDSLAAGLKWPEDLDIRVFADAGLVPSPACMAVSALGDVYVGVDKMGSLGKDMGYGAIVKLIDCNGDGILDTHSEFAKVDNPRGILAMGHQVFVLHTRFSPETKKAENMDLIVFEDNDNDGVADSAAQLLITNLSNPTYLAERGTDHATNGIQLGIDGWIYIAVGDFGFHNATDRDGTRLTMLGGGVLRVRPDGTEMEVYTHGLRNIYDHRWPEMYNQTPLMADWGRSYLYRHPVTADGPTYTQREEPFIQLPQITDIDIDGSGIMYLSAWDGAGYSGSPDIGYIVRAVPREWTYQPFDDVTKKSDRLLVKLLESPDAKARQAAQFELLSRKGGDRISSSVWKLVENSSLGKAQRVAALYTYAQLADKAGIDRLVEATQDTSLQEFALRALADRKGWAGAVPAEPFLAALQSDNPRIQAVATIGVGRLGIRQAIGQLLATQVPVSFKAPALGTEGPHATPNAEIIIPHLSVKALVALDAVAECIDALNSGQADMALWAMRYFHDDRVVNALIGSYDRTDDAAYRRKVINTLARIYYREPAYDASWWWGTRPDTHGPYYRTEEWTSTPAIRGFLVAQWEAADKGDKTLYSALNTKYQLGIDRFGTIDLEVAREEAMKVDLEAIQQKKGQVGESSIEDILLALEKIKGDPEAGAAIFVRQGCVACHSVDKGEALKGPFMGQIGSIMNREKIAESILKPNASISQGFATVQLQTKSGEMHMGFVTAESADKLTIRNIAGLATEIKTADIKERKELDMSMMPEGLANALSFEELASLVAYLEGQK